MAPSDASSRHRWGNLVEAGDRVRITIVDGTQYEVTVISISDGVIYGKHLAIKIGDRSSVGRRTFSILKTTGLAAGMLVGLGTAAVVWMVYILTSSG